MEASATRGVGGWVCWLLFLALQSCAWRDPKLGLIDRSPVPPPLSNVPYRIQPGDELEIRFHQSAEFNVIMPVRPDGFISMPLAYEMLAAGRTVEELRRELVERYSRELNQPEIAVIIRSFAGYVVHVGGEVERPGMLELSAPRTVLEAVLQAGGFTSAASLSNVVVMRRAEAGYELIESDLYAVLSGEDGRGNFALQAGDVVFVPPTGIAEVNSFVEHYIRNNLPVNFSLSYRINPDNE